MMLITQSLLWDAILVLASFWIALYFYFTRKFGYWKERGLPYRKPWPFVGNALDIFIMKKSIGDLCLDLYKSTTAPLLGFFVCAEPCLLIKDVQLIRTILVKDFAEFSNRTMTNNIKDDPLGSHMLFLSKTPIWREIRRKMTPAFTSGKTKLMHELIRESAVEMMAYLHKEVKANPIVETREVAAKFTTEGISSTAFGVRANCFKDENALFRVVSRTFFNWSIPERAISTTCYFAAPLFVRLFKLKFMDAFSTSFMRESFWNIMKEREASQIVRNDLIDILIDVRKNDSPDDPWIMDGDMLVAQAGQFFVAGSETSSTTISFALYELARNPDIQRRVREEVKTVKRNHGLLSYDAMKDMKYLEMCIKETLRIYPVLPFLDRRCSSDYKIPGTDVTLKNGTAVFISCFGLHSDPQFFPNPEKYDPERFSERNAQNIKPFTYLPFGEGPRNCIGARYGMLTTMLGVAHIIQDFELETCHLTQNPMRFDPRGFLVAPIGGLRLRFNKIHS